MHGVRSAALIVGIYMVTESSTTTRTEVIGAIRVNGGDKVYLVDGSNAG